MLPCVKVPCPFPVPRQKAVPPGFKCQTARIPLLRGPWDLCLPLWKEGYNNLPHRSIVKLNQNTRKALTKYLAHRKYPTNISLVEKADQIVTIKF